MKEGRQVTFEAPRIARLPESLNSRSGDSIPGFFGKRPGAAFGLDAPERVGERIDKLGGTGLHGITGSDASYQWGRFGRTNHEARNSALYPVNSKTPSLFDLSRPAENV